MKKPRVKIIDKGFKRLAETMRVLDEQKKRVAAVGILASTGSKPKRSTEREVAKEKERRARVKASLNAIKGRTDVDEERNWLKSSLKPKTRLTVLEVATYHEFGLGVPQRSFIRGYADKHRRDSIEFAKKRVANIIKNADVEGAQQLLDVLGLRARGGMQVFIANRGEGTYPALAPATVARRKANSDVPLFDTGQLRSSIAYAVRSKRGGE